MRRARELDLSGGGESGDWPVTLPPKRSAIVAVLWPVLQIGQPL